MRSQPISYINSQTHASRWLVTAEAQPNSCRTKHMHDSWRQLSSRHDGMVCRFGWVRRVSRLRHNEFSSESIAHSQLHATADLLATQLPPGIEGAASWVFVPLPTTDQAQHKGGPAPPLSRQQRNKATQSTTDKRGQSCFLPHSQPCNNTNSLGRFKQAQTESRIPMGSLWPASQPTASTHTGGTGPPFTTTRVLSHQGTAFHIVKR